MVVGGYRGVVRNLGTARVGREVPAHEVLFGKDVGCVDKRDSGDLSQRRVTAAVADQWSRKDRCANQGKVPYRAFNETRREEKLLRIVGKLLKNFG